MFSVEIAAAQKEATGLAHHFAARFAHMRSTIGAIAGNINLVLRRLGLWLGQCLYRHSRIRWIVIGHGFIFGSVNPVV
jgi:hypothetical protein